jgi:uncharacterized membrane protein
VNVEGGLVERLRTSLFVVPLAFVLGAVAAAQVSLVVDRNIGDGDELPFNLAATVESAREVLSTVAGATITFAGIAFSVSLLVIQRTGAQYSPRVVPNLFRDRFNTRVMGLVVGTFTYCLIVLRSVRGALDDAGEPVVPHLSVAIAVLLGIVAVLAIVAFIDHSAHSMDVSEILRRVADAAAAETERSWPDAVGAAPAPRSTPDGDGTVVRLDRDGWIQGIDLDAMAAVLPAGATLRLDVAVGRYAVPGTPLGTLWPPLGSGPADELAARLRRALRIGPSRTLSGDPLHGLRQLADVGIRALSPGVNDPTTAQDAIFHLVGLLAVQLHRAPTTSWDGPDDQVVLLDKAPAAADMVDLAFDELRRDAATNPAVSVYLLEALHLLHRSLAGGGPQDAVEAIDRQAALVVATAAAAGLIDADLATVTGAHAARFDPS